MNEIKILLATILIIISARVESYGQKTLSEYRILSNWLEQVDPSSIPDLQSYQRAKFKDARGNKLFEVEFQANKYNHIFRLKGQDDLVLLSQRLSDELVNDWDKAVPRYIDSFAPVDQDNGYERYSERINNDAFEAYIFFTKNYKLSNANFALYRDKESKLILFITYLSNAADEVKIANMRNIIRDIKFK